MFPGSNLNSNAKLCFLLLIWIQFQSFFKIVIPTHIQSFTPEFLFEFELKASFSNCYSYSNSNLKFSLRIPMFEFFFYALFPNTYLNWNTKSGFRIFIWIRKAWFTNYYSYSNSDPKICFRILIGILFLTRIRKPNFEFKFE